MTEAGGAGACYRINPAGCVQLAGEGVNDSNGFTGVKTRREINDVCLTGQRTLPRHRNRFKGERVNH